ncbi:MAG: DUF1858 domain-containing protein [Nanoarchaeota archaeon]|nr:DUF1858 domain-containing protein [Nanoarchaeota archaeon]
MSDKKINKDMTFGDIMRVCPECSEILLSYGLHCIGCHVAAFETLEQGCKAHGLSDEQVEEMVKKINDLIDKKGE